MGWHGPRSRVPWPEMARSLITRGSPSPAHLGHLRTHRGCVSFLRKWRRTRRTSAALTPWPELCHSVTFVRGLHRNRVCHTAYSSTVPCAARRHRGISLVEPLGARVCHQPLQLVVAEALNLLVAREKTGKSLLALGCSLPVARGAESYAGLTVSPGRVVYLDAENGVHESHRRIRRLSAMPIPPDQFTYLQHDAVPFQLDAPDAFEVLAEVVNEYRPDLIVLDSFRSLWSGEENHPGEVAAVLDPLRNFLRQQGVAGLLLHHENAKGGTRGCTGVTASVENIVKMTRSANGGRQLDQLPSRFGEVLDQPYAFRGLAGELPGLRTVSGSGGER